jgi:hypothetical protein
MVYLDCIGVMDMLGAKIAGKTNDAIKSNGYKESSRKRAEDFTRKRGMAFDEVVMFMLTRFKNCTTATALRRFFESVLDAEAISQQAFSLARYKIKVSAFVALFILTVETMLGDCRKNWHGYRVLAVDGTKIALPDSKEL